MIAKQYRLTARELGKVLSRRKPFFSHMFIANLLPNRGSHGRCAILLSGKVARGSVNRNFWRRKFYDISAKYILLGSDFPALDIVFVPKKGTTLQYKNKKQLAEFEKNIQFIYQKLLKIQ